MWNKASARWHSVVLRTIRPILSVVSAWLVLSTLLCTVSHAQVPPTAGEMKKLSVDDLFAAAGTLAGVQVEMDGIERIDSTEVWEGRYQLTIWGKHTSPCFQAVLPFKWAVIAQRSKQLIVSVKDTSKTPPTLTIYGNKLSEGGSSPGASVVWDDDHP